MEILHSPAPAGWPVAVHAIGDLANREALDAFEDPRRMGAARAEESNRARPAAGADDVERFADVGVAASVQFSHATSDRDVADRYWAGKTDGAYAFRSLAGLRAVVANGSDAPIEELDPLAGIRAGVLRTIDDRPAWHPEQTLTVEQAFQATCVTCVALLRRAPPGKLVPGYLADLVVLDRDPFELEELADVGGHDGRRPLDVQPRPGIEMRGTGFARSGHAALGERKRQIAPAPRAREARARLHTVAESRETFSEAKKRAEELFCPPRPRAGCGRREGALVRRVDVPLWKIEARDHRRDPFLRKRRDYRQRPAHTDQQWPRPHDALERVLRQLDRGRIRRD